LNNYNNIIKKINYYYYNKKEISKNISSNYNNFRKASFSKIIIRYNALRKKIFLFKKIDLKDFVKFGGYSMKKNEITDKIGLNLWALSKNFIRSRYDSYKYPKLRRKKNKWLKKIIFKIATKMK